MDNKRTAADKLQEMKKTYKPFTSLEYWDMKKLFENADHCSDLMVRCWENTAETIRNEIADDMHIFEHCIEYGIDEYRRGTWCKITDFEGFARVMYSTIKGLLIDAFATDKNVDDIQETIDHICRKIVAYDDYDMSGDVRYIETVIEDCIDDAYKFVDDPTTQLDVALNMGSLDDVIVNVNEWHILTENETAEIMDTMSNLEAECSDIYSFNQLTGIRSISNAIAQYMEIIDSDMDADAWKFSENCTVEEILYNLNNGGYKFHNNGDIIE